MYIFALDFKAKRAFCHVESKLETRVKEKVTYIKERFTVVIARFARKSITTSMI